MKQILKYTPVIVLGLIVCLSRPAHAASIISVNSTDDTQANDGACTLREAISSANDDTASGVAAGECVAGSGTDTIRFAITGIADFTNDGQSGYTIKPQSQLPDITSPVTIEGYSQANSQANTAAAPELFNGTLLVELDGSDLGSSLLFYGLTFAAGSSGSVVNGLVINSFHGSGITIDTADITVQGNYIGTDPTGLIDKGNSYAGITNPGGFDSTGVDALIGGLAAADRNIISGNDGSGAYPSSRWTLQGNYIGIGSDGLTPIGNSFDGGPGGISIDAFSDVLVGGPQATATNIFSGNYNQGIAPDLGSGLTIENNYIGVGYDGATAIPNGTIGTGGPGIQLTNLTNAAIKNNIISANVTSGIFTNDVDSVSITGNTIGSGADGTEDLGNSDFGVHVGPRSYQIIIGGTDPADSNRITNNGHSGVTAGYNPTSDSQFSALGNSISNNGELGIALRYGGIPLPNDDTDADSGPNNLLNTPSNIKYHEDGGSTLVRYNQDVPAGNYHVEFFVSTLEDASGSGEGETLIGSQNISVSPSQHSFTTTISGTGFTNIAATATLIDSSEVSGYGPTSEFSATEETPTIETDLSITKTLTNPQAVSPGATLHYDLAVTNNGYSPIDISNLDGSGTPVNSVYWDLLPPDLTFASNDNPNITCSDLGSAIVGQLAANHANYHFISCAYSGSGQILDDGDSITDTMNVVVNNDSDLQFTNYAITGLPDTDPDTNALIAVLGTAFGNEGVPDFIDTVVADPPNSFVSAVYPIPVAPADTNSATPPRATSKLVVTGHNIAIATIAGLSLVTASLATVKRRRSVNYTA